MNQAALNVLLQERITEAETELLTLHKKVLSIRYEIDNDPEYVRNLYGAYKKAREARLEQSRREAICKAQGIKIE